jgi:gamma-glutamylputrescine oxidase
MSKPWPPQNQVFWYLQRKPIPPCRQTIETEIAIIGGGIAGLSAAHAFHKRGKKVILLEQYYCGSGASGKSSGFITQNAELSLTDFEKQYGSDAARTIWQFITSGVEDIRNNIMHHNFNCDYAPQDTLVLADTKGALNELKTEQAHLEKMGYTSSFYDATTVKKYIGSTAYYGGVEYKGTFGIDAYCYCQSMKELLQKSGVTIFEETPVTAINDHTLETMHARITADFIIVCTDHFTPQLGLLSKEIYHAQTFLMISQVLTDDEIHAIFPTKNFLAWDTQLIYNYFRVTANKRLLLGGGSILTTFLKEKPAYKPLIKKLTNYFQKRFPHLTIQFEQCWPGLIGISKDIAPIAGRDQNRPYIYYVTAATGLPIAAALGRYSAEHIVDGNDNLDSYFSPYRKFPIGGILQSLLGTKLSFALSNYIKTQL